MAQKPGQFLRDQLTVETKETLQAQKPTQTEPDVIEDFLSLNNKDFSYSNIQARQNKSHNRYSDILPWDNFIPKIEGLECSYCNASIWLHGGRNIIMAQAPLQNTLEQFWAVIYQHKVAAIVKLVENNPTLCFFYWPEVGQSYEAGRYRIYCLEYKQTTPPIEFSYRILEITDLKSSTENKHTAVMFDYPNRPENEFPDNCGTLFTIIQAAHKISQNIRKPILVHCSNGIGRTGMFCAIQITLSNVLDCLIDYRNARGSTNILIDDLLLKQLETQFSQFLPLPQVILSLRASRHPKV
ncbi:MAG: putative Tyrosine-protein phosphatase non-receptor type 1 [Streblomastix strix]|uniref:Putative Tyrosine-protein phosphatase non-receptor type 1 n=1 Tax=Streblomastix strix TaxID=222440 RepID=A0A5J4UKC6_9EUKA|nr:MAG: putative Tyrosine-protein phosphatase non-receptor type 1 [Streblomastix strix]